MKFLPLEMSLNGLKIIEKNSLSVYDNLPLETSPLYNKYTDAKKWILKKYLFQQLLLKLYLLFFKKDWAKLEHEICIIQIGTNIHRINLPEELKSKGVVISSISDAIQNNSELVKKALEASNSNDDKSQL